MQFIWSSVHFRLFLIYKASEKIYNVRIERTCIWELICIHYSTKESSAIYKLTTNSRMQFK